MNCVGYRTEENDWLPRVGVLNRRVFEQLNLLSEGRYAVLGVTDEFSGRWKGTNGVGREPWVDV